MASEDRSFATIAQEVVGSIRQIIRLELKLARAEISESAVAMRQGAVLLAVGGAVLLYTVGLLLLAAVHALSLVLAPWAAALVVAGVTALVALICIVIGMQRLKLVGLPTRTIAALQENVS